MPTPRVNWQAIRSPSAGAAWAIVGIAGLAAAAVILYTGRDTTFNQDELFYYARLVDDGGVLGSHPFGVGYLLAPSNGHLAVVGKLIYEALFATAGTGYFVFRLVAVVAILVACGLFFELGRRRLPALAAIALTVLLLFFGAAWEVLLWPFDMHTVIALAAGLGAVLAIEAETRRGDLVACLLLVLAIGTIELGLAFLVGIALLILVGGRAPRRLWIVLVPGVLYSAWWVWSRHFDQPDIVWSNLRGLPESVLNSVGSTVGAIVGAFDTGPGVMPQTLGIESWTGVLGVVAVGALCVAVVIRRPPPALWCWVAVAAVYWSLIALAARPPDSSRYMFAGGILVLLIAADLSTAKRLSIPALGLLVVFLALSLSAQFAKLDDGRVAQVTDAQVSRTEYTMLELARDQGVDPDYRPSVDARVSAAGLQTITGLPAGFYFDAADRVGSLALPLAAIRAESEPLRAVADATLVGAVGTAPVKSAGPERSQTCETVGRSDRVERVRLATGRTDVLGLAPGVRLGLGRFVSARPSVAIGDAPAGAWRSINLARDGAPDPWWLFMDGPLRICREET